MSDPLAAKYLNLLGSRKAVRENSGHSRRAIIHAPLDLPHDLTRELLASTEARLNFEFEKGANADISHRALIDDTLSHASKGLSVIANDGAEATLTDTQAAALEAVVIANGTRPSIKIEDIGQDDHPHFGEWKASFTEFRAQISTLSKSVGRIDKSGGHCGTGFVVAPGLIMTNRHVLQDIAAETTRGDWTFEKDISINFGDASYPILPEVIYAGRHTIGGAVDINKADIAILRCGGGLGSFPEPVTFKRSESDIMKGRYVYVLGFPGRPAPGYENYAVLRRLFNLEYGVKRVSPGEIDTALGDLSDDLHGTVFEHDCTSLGGNSGSPIIDFDETGLSVFGLHFAGAKRIGNYAHAATCFRNDIEDLGLRFD